VIEIGTVSATASVVLKSTDGRGELDIFNGSIFTSQLGITFEGAGGNLVYGNNMY
jgi:hypothetical protein